MRDGEHQGVSREDDEDGDGVVTEQERGNPHIVVRGGQL